MRAMLARASIVLAGLLALCPLTASGHGGEPTITGLRAPAHRPGEVWAITDNQGLYAHIDGQTAWLCEDAVAPAAGIDEIVALGDGQRWLILTEDGLFTSDDGGCSFGGAPNDLADQQIAALSAHPLRVAEAVAVAETFGAENDVWLTTDGGGTWRAMGLALRGRFTGLLRSEGDPQRLYALHDRGAFTSADGGRRWRAITLGPPELGALPSAMTLLAAPAGGAERLFAGIELPTGLALVASDDAGQTWREALRVDDFEAELVFDAAGRQGLLLTAFDGVRRTADGGETWVAEPLPVDRLQRIARGPDGRLWGSTGLFFGGPFALGVSADFGRTWAPVMVRFEDVQRRWDCPPMSPARACCDTLCPGLPQGAMCADQVPDEGGACAIEPGPPPGALPGFEPDMGVDAEPPDAALPDARPADAEVDRGADAAWDGAVELDRGPPDQGAVDAAPDARPDVEPDRARPDMPADGKLPNSGELRLDGGPPNYAPDVTVIPANAPRSGCRQGHGSNPPPPALLLTLLLLGRSTRRARRRPRRASAR